MVLSVFSFAFPFPRAFVSLFRQPIDPTLDHSTIQQRVGAWNQIEENRKSSWAAHILFISSLVQYSIWFEANTSRDFFGGQRTFFFLKKPNLCIGLRCYTMMLSAALVIVKSRKSKIGVEHESFAMEGTSNVPSSSKLPKIFSRHP